MNDKSKNIILKLLKGIAYAYPIGFIALTLQWEYDLLSIIPYELQSLIDDLFYFGESSNVFDYGSWLPDRFILTYLFLLIIHFYIRSKIKLTAKKQHKKKTRFRSLVEKIGTWNNTGDLNNTDNYSNGVFTIGGAALIVIFAIGTINYAVEFGDYLIVTDEEKAEMREQEAQKRQRERERQQAIENKRKRERIAELLPNAHPNVRRAIEAKGLELSCKDDENYTITFDDLYVYVEGDSNFKNDLESFIEQSGVHDSGFNGGYGSGIRYERFLNFKNWENLIALERRVPNTMFEFISMGRPQSRGCRATFNESSNNPLINPTLKPKDPKSNTASASKKIQDIRESVENRTQGKD